MNQILPEEEVRKGKLLALREMGIDPYPARTKRSLSIGVAIKDFGALSKAKKNVTLAGRMMTRRKHGGVAFVDLRDGAGQLQLIVRKDAVGAKQFDLLNDYFDPADFIEATGTLAKSKTGEKSLLAKSFKMLSKSLRPLPEKWHGLQDTEARYRKRYLDLLINEEVRNRFIVKDKIVQTIRQFLLAEDFLEVETPVLQPLAGGALATPFKTRYEALDTDVYLRIAPELYLKRLLVAGFEKVFEFARVFRNEGVSREHLQDFNMLEFYQAYADYNDLMKLVEKMFVAIVKAMGHKDLKVSVNGKSVSFKPPFKRATMRDLILKNTSIDIDKYDTADQLAAAMKEQGIKLDFAGSAGLGKLIDELYKEKVRPTLLGPIFVMDHPVELSPLAKKHLDNPKRVQRFQLLIGGWEITNCFTELNDPLDQRERFAKQVQEKKAGDKEAHAADEAFVEALEHGMPPTVGFGMGIERVTAVLTNAENIREAVLFPFVKNKE
jgi:lysyl-tRNA synthetase class 2